MSKQAVNNRAGSNKEYFMPPKLNVEELSYTFLKCNHKELFEEGINEIEHILSVDKCIFGRII